MFFKKKRDSQSNSQAVDELPQLAMDVINQQGAPPQAPQYQQGQVPPQQHPAPGQVPPKQVPAQRIPPQAPQQQRPMQQGSTVLPQVSDDEQEHSYFAELLDQLGKQNEDLKEDIALRSQRLLEGSLLENMKKSWERKKQDALFTYEEQNLKERITEKIQHLQDLEKEWQEYHLKVIEKEEEVRSQETELKSMLGDFRDLCKRHVKRKTERSLEESVPLRAADPSRVFVTHNGQKIQTTRELVSFIRSLSAVGIRRYVGKEKNDFANWVRYAFNDSKLANKMLLAANKEELLNAFKP